MLISCARGYENNLKTMHSIANDYFEYECDTIHFKRRKNSYDDFLILLKCIFHFFCRNSKDQYLADLTRDNVQLIVNELWKQPTERVEECIVARLPAPSFVLPRSRKCPVAKPLTKWEQFALEKGIQKTKKDKKVFDEELDVRYLLLLTEFNCMNFIECFY